MRQMDAGEVNNSAKAADSEPNAPVSVSAGK